MKKIYKLMDDGSQIMAASATELVTKMRDSSRFASDQTFFEYMEGFADRYRIQSGNIVRCDRESNFVEDLLKFGFLKVVENG